MFIKAEKTSDELIEKYNANYMYPIAITTCKLCVYGLYMYVVLCKIYNDIISEAHGTKYFFTQTCTCRYM